MKQNLDVIGIGASTIDCINVVDNFDITESVQKTKKFRMDCGGPVSTALAALARLGARTAMIDSIGDDLAGEFILSEYLKEKVDTTHIRTNSNSNSSVSSILVRASDGARIIYYSASEASELTSSDLDFKFLAQTKYIHLNGRHLDAALAAAQFAGKNGIKVSFDGGSHRYRPELDELIKFSNVFIAAKQFAETFTSESNVDKAAEFILSQGPDIVVITAGTSGSYLYTKNIKAYHQKAFIHDKIIDTTGCGDCYHGAFLFGLLNEWDLPKVIEFASAAAALNARELGGRAALPTRNEVNNLIKNMNP